MPSRRFCLFNTQPQAAPTTRSRCVAVEKQRPRNKRAHAAAPTGRENKGTGQFTSGSKTMTFAVIKTGGKQYKVAANDLVRIEKIPGDAGEVVTFENVLMVGDAIGTPLVEGALVAGEVVEQFRDKKVIVFKKKRRQGYRRTLGHRQELTLVRITEILTGGAKPSGKKAAAPKKPAAKAADTKPAEKKAEEKTPKAAPAAAEGVKDDVKLIGGVGPALEKKLAGLGVTSLSQIAAWTAEDIERVDGELNFKGRIEREEWVEQAKELLAGKPPRAKADQ